MKRNLLTAQSGGPTAAINSSLAGVVFGGLSSADVDKVYGAVNGIEGVLKENIIDMGGFADKGMLELLKQTPSSYLGSCRRKLPEKAENEELYEKIFSVFEKYSIGYFLYIGGNDSMDTVKKLSEYAKEKGHETKIAGVPKTIDNDLAVTDHTPGYGSAAKFVANSVRQLYLDTLVYDMKSVVVTEIMGRNAGWLTAGASLANSGALHPVDIVCLPEAVFDFDAFAERLNSVMKEKNTTIITVSEGIKDSAGNYIAESKISRTGGDGFAHASLGGVGKTIEHFISEKLHIKTRSIEFSTLQRCFSQNASLCDIEESFAVGRAAVDFVTKGQSGIMPGFVRLSDEPYKIEIKPFDVAEIANLEKRIPKEMLSEDGMNVTEAFEKYARPLILGEPRIEYQNGVIELLKR